MNVKMGTMKTKQEYTIEALATVIEWLANRYGIDQKTLDGLLAAACSKVTSKAEEPIDLLEIQKASKELKSNYLHHAGSFPTGPRQ